jgi:hypothetical protein
MNLLITSVCGKIGNIRWMNTSTGLTGTGSNRHVFTFWGGCGFGDGPFQVPVELVVHHSPTGAVPALSGGSGSDAAAPARMSSADTADH